MMGKNRETKNRIVGNAMYSGDTQSAGIVSARWQFRMRAIIQFFRVGMWACGHVGEMRSG